MARAARVAVRGGACVWVCIGAAWLSPAEGASTAAVAATTAASSAAKTTAAASAPGAVSAPMPAASAVRPVALPAPADLRAWMGSGAGSAPVTVTVREPHLVRNGQMPEVRYVGHDATAVLTRLLGAGWRTPGQELEFRALDGFVSRIPVERFARYRAWLVVARADGAAFEVDNHLQGEREVPLGPYYLVWDNRASKALQAEGGALWPYQVASIGVGPSSLRALLPAGMPARFAQDAELARVNCLSCHRIRGYGGDKMPLDLAVVVRGYDAATWRRWLLEPAAVRSGTTMPPLAEGLPPAERAALAQRLYDYLRALPAQPAGR